MPLSKRRRGDAETFGRGFGPEYRAGVLLLFSLAKKVAKKAIAQAARSLAPHTPGRLP
ncbi:MAG TPA: hypothetical protein PK926_10980 [Spirochaetota bacterium]|nr:hypothetical protein [Spirochaetota bacterium]HPI88427.1 hypothetical protein [Spirochaetota bacterium]HPR48791.1 hypothetical protein [Spirochaetota bacterium]